MPPAPETLRQLVPPYLARQPWFAVAAGGDPSPLRLEAVRTIDSGPPGLASVIVANGALRCHLLVGWRPAAALAGRLRNEDDALIGAAEEEGTPVIYYDALADDELARRVLEVATGQPAQGQLVRAVTSLSSHASLVIGERALLKCYRLLEAGPRPEAEVLFGLDAVGFNALPAPLGRWQEDGEDLALAREFLPSALEGRLLALTSLRDLLAYASPGIAFDPAQPGAPPDADQLAASAGGDLSSELLRLGETTGRLHLALAAAFGATPHDPGPLLAGERLPTELAGVPGLGAAIQLHGDYHLRRVMRAEAGWIVTGFSDDPFGFDGSAASSRAPRRGSPLEDLADMTASIRRIADEALERRPRRERQQAAELAAAWERRGNAAFLHGWRRVRGIETLAPEASRFPALLAHFEGRRARPRDAEPPNR